MCKTFRLLLLIAGIGLCASACADDTSPSPPLSDGDGEIESFADGDTEAEATGVSARFALPPHTQGRYIQDAKGARLRLTGFNWNGAEGPDFVPSGLDKQSAAAIAKAIYDSGFNSVRLVWSNELVEKNPVIAAERLSANPELIGKTALEVLDAVIATLSQAGVLVILNNHISDAIWCCQTTDGNTLWYNERFPESKWLDDWRAIATRYKNEKAVIGADLRNEPRGAANWGAALGAKYDWASAAERGGRAVLEVAPEWLIIVEGTQFAVTLSEAEKRPIVLPVPGRLVYEIHNYPWFGTDQDTAETLTARWREQWGFLLESATPVPIWLGEFGLCNACLKNGKLDELWFDTITGLIAEKELDWSFWRLHGDGDWGVFNPATNQPYSTELINRLQALGGQSRSSKD